jgi:hypothetical protein
MRCRSPGKLAAPVSVKRRIVWGGQGKTRDGTQQTHKRHHDDDDDSAAVSICECCAWESRYHAMRALHNPVGLGMGQQNREFLSLLVLLWFIRIFPLFRLSEWGEIGGRGWNLQQRHSLRKGRKREGKKDYDISNVWQSSGEKQTVR